MIVHAVMRVTEPLPPTQLAPSPSASTSGPDHASPVALDVYALETADLTRVRGIVFAGDVDQVFLHEIRPKLDAFVRGGARVLVNGHVQRPFLEGLSPWRKLAFSGPRDLRLTRQFEHPVWAGTDPEDFLYNTGIPGTHSREELSRIGVAGFYGRGYVSRVPEDAIVVHTLGTVAAPIDIDYPLGEGRVLVHCGNDLGQFISADRGTGHMAQQLASWLTARTDPQQDVEEMG